MRIFRFLITSVTLWMTGAGFAGFGQSVEETQKLHLSALTAASASVERTNLIAEQDSLRPIYHVTASSRFINDPNGPVCFAGEYHIFFQHLPFWGDSVHNKPVWGHAASKDMVHWYYLPIALAPTPGTYDSEAIASGSCVIHKCFAFQHEFYRDFRFCFPG